MRARVHERARARRHIRDPRYERTRSPGQAAGGLYVMLDLILSRGNKVWLGDMATIVGESGRWFDLAFRLDLRHLPGLLTIAHYLCTEPWRQRKASARTRSVRDHRSTAILGSSTDRRRVRE
jgi:hypothetical protein